MKQVTIKEVAARANVSISTVSRVLNNNYPVSPESRKKVLEAISQTNYQPNDIARSLKRRSTQTIGVIIADISNLFYMHIVKGIESVVGPQGYTLFLASSNEDEKKERQILETFKEKRVDGIIITPCSQDGSYINQLNKSNIAVVLVDRKIDGLDIDVITEDNYSSSYQLTKHLIETGHEKIAFVSGMNRGSTGKERFEGYRKALEDYNIPYNANYLLAGNLRKEEAYNALLPLLKNEQERPSAIFAANNLMAEGAIRALQECNLVIAQDISLVSFGDLVSAEIFKPQLTIIQQRPFSLGEHAGLLTLQRINEKASKGFKKTRYKELVLASEIRYGDSVRNVNRVKQ